MCRFCGVRGGDIRILVLAGERAGEPGGHPYPYERYLRDPERLRETIQSVLEQGGRRILIDMEKTTYLDSAALGSLAFCYKRVMERGGELAILRPTGKVRALLKIINFDRICRVFDDEAAAVAAMSA